MYLHVLPTYHFLQLSMRSPMHILVLEMDQSMPMIWAALELRPTSQVVHFSLLMQTMFVTTQMMPVLVVDKY